MPKNLLIFLITIIIASCRNSGSENNTKEIVDEEIADTSTKKTSRERIDRIFNNPYRNINEFDIVYGNKFIDSVHNNVTNSEFVEYSLTKDICRGDFCESYQTLNNKENQSILYLLKGDMGEYGFSNNQYFLLRDSLRFVRNCRVDVMTNATDTSATVWQIEEITFEFENEKVTCKRKISRTNNLDGFDFSLSNEKTDTIEVDPDKTYKDLNNKLSDSLKRKDSKDPDE